jgi:hypothetical protein
MVILWLTPTGTIQIHQVDSLDPNAFECLRYFQWIVGNDLFGSKIAPF